jgi:hypothetical protein
MLRLFQASKISRLPYIIVLICLVGFDFAKVPIQNYLQHASGKIQAQILADSIKNNTTFAELGRKMDNRVSPEDIQRRMQTGHDITPEDILKAGDAMLAEQAKSAAVGSVYVSILVAMGVASYVVLIWMVFARVRDIAWPIAVGFAVLALPLFNRLFGASVPEAMFYVVQGAFFLVLLGLAVVPSNFGDPIPETDHALPQPPLRPVGPQIQPRAAVAGRFGRRV